MYILFEKQAHVFPYSPEKNMPGSFGKEIKFGKIQKLDFWYLLMLLIPFQMYLINLLAVLQAVFY